MCVEHRSIQSHYIRSNALTQSFAVNKFGSDEAEIVSRADLVDRKDVGVVKTRLQPPAPTFERIS